MAVPVIVIMVVAMAVIVPVPVSVSMTRIGAADRREGLGHVADLGAEPLEHRLDDMIAQDEDAVGGNGCRQMPVADVPGEFEEMNAVARAHFMEILVGGFNRHHAPVLQQEFVAGAEYHRLGQIDEHRSSIGQSDRLAAEVTFVVRQDDGHAGRSRRIGPSIGRVPDRGCT